MNKQIFIFVVLTTHGLNIKRLLIINTQLTTNEPPVMSLPSKLAPKKFPFTK